MVNKLSHVNCHGLQAVDKKKQNLFGLQPLTNRLLLFSLQGLKPLTRGCLSSVFPDLKVGVIEKATT